MRRKRPVEEHALSGTVDLGSKEFLLVYREGDAALEPYRLWAHNVRATFGQPGPKRPYTQFIQIQTRRTFPTAPKDLIDFSERMPFVIQNSKICLPRSRIVVLKRNGVFERT